MFAYLTVGYYCTVDWFRGTGTYVFSVLYDISGCYRNLSNLGHFSK
jgi:hypothetical protein